MKTAVRIMIFSVLALLLLIVGNVSVFAEDIGFSTDDLTKEKQKDIFNNLEFTVLSDEPGKTAIRNFDVNKNGEIVISRQVFNRATVCVYDSCGQYLYGFGFIEYGDFGVLFSGEYLDICFIRGDLVLTVNSEGDLIKIEKIQNTYENREYWENGVFATRRTNDNTEYTLKNDKGFFNFFSAKYTQLEIKTSDGENKLIYDVNSEQLFIDFLILAFVLGMIAVVAISMTREFKNGRKRWRERANDPNR